MAKRGFGQTGAQDGEERKKITKESFQRGLRIFSYVLPYKFKFIVGLGFLLFSSLTFMAFPYLVGQLFDSATGNSTGILTNINVIAMGLFGVILLQGVFSFFRVYFFAQVSENAVADIRRDLYSKFMQLPISFYEKRRVGEITSRITTDVAQVQDAMSITLAELFRQFTTLIVGVIIIMWTSIKLSLFMLATFPVLIVLAMVFGRRIKTLSKKTQDELANTNVIVEETLQAINTVKAFTNEMFEVNRYRTTLAKAVKTAITTANYRGAFISFIIIGLFGGIILVIWYGATLVANGDINQGDLVSFVLYTAFIGASVGGLGELYGKVQSALGATERILEILQEQEEPTDKSLRALSQVPRVQGNITYRNVAFSYPTRPDIQVLKDISFEARAGEKVAVVGPSGAGKSTIIQLLMRFYDVQGGSITVDGKDLRSMDLTTLRGNIGIVPQEVLLFGGTIKENIAYGRPEATEAEIIEAAKKANAYNFIESFPEGLDTLVGERGIKLSGGQRQRVAIARAILKNPVILILDEATSSLDSESEQLVQQAMDVLMKDRTTIIIAHRLATIRKADKILVIDGGEIVEEGSHEQLSANDNGIYANLLRLQFELS
ncbi:ATP-binding cassette domain-containing protein [Pontibacter sp. BT310]|uniref:ATP-binding cassette domain-containing protein n=1 Tax=Pontibacter populi TaxID=890055 RepID=A0ABS6X743_9BACT|nr:MULTISPECIES: ABC transporter transmembrane domain-containing protein [Pontibacter]MBJ6116970.1 ATP-binding cassette domain-containing protein [Pontibacter sp. BT310]MBR0569394.1 ATP-binding cassette domain-containing protein [Microvirga sp. STS03]MBW3363823.1 ATP-binding cassette domain-containing protein [Pontibacter populi]